MLPASHLCCLQNSQLILNSIKIFLYLLWSHADRKEFVHKPSQHSCLGMSKIFVFW